MPIGNSASVVQKLCCRLSGGSAKKLMVRLGPWWTQMIPGLQHVLMLFDSNNAMSRMRSGWKSHARVLAK